jgi:molecular chaperone DnaK
MTRESFEERTSDLLARTAMTSRQVVGAAGLRWSDIDRVLLVGGSSRMPAVRNMLRDITGHEPHGEVNPDEAVARGAALYAGHLLSQRRQAARAAAPGGPQAGGPQASDFSPVEADRSDSDASDTKDLDLGPGDLQVTNVSAHSLGIEGYNVQLGRRCNTVLIPRNSPLPARLTRQFVTRKAGQQSIVVQVLEGESTQVQECTRVGRLVIRNLPRNLPASTPIRVTYEYGANGRLNITAQISGSNAGMDLELQRSGERSAGQINAWRQVLSGEPLLEHLEPLALAEAAGAGSITVSGDSDVLLPEDELLPPRPSSPP